MDINKVEQTIETLPGFYPLTVVEFVTGYGCNVYCGQHIIGYIDEANAGNFRARIDKAYTTQSGRFFTSDDFNDRAAAVQWIRDKWVAFLHDIKEPDPIEMIIGKVDGLIAQIASALDVSAEQLKKDIAAVDYKIKTEKVYGKACRIRCPQCGMVQDAAIEYYTGDPFESYVHHCTQCKHIITESEWNEVTPVDEIMNGNGDKSQPGGVMK